MDRIKGQVIGFRQWTVTREFALGSISGRNTWNIGVNVAECIPQVYFAPGRQMTHQDVSPVLKCTCGLHAYYLPFPYRYSKHGFVAAQNTVSQCSTLEGIVTAWGKIEVHTNGFRAQYAKIVGIGIPEGYQEAAIARRIATLYGVAAVSWSAMIQVAGEFGDPVPMDLRPEGDPYFKAQMAPRIPPYYGEETR